MKTSSALLLAAMTACAGLAYAQTTTPSTTGTLAYIPLIPSSTGTTSTPSTAISTWFIDVAKNQVVMCSQSGTPSSTAAPTFNCTAQAVPAAVSGTTGTTGTSGTNGTSGTTGATGATGGAGMSPL